MKIFTKLIIPLLMLVGCMEESNFIAEIPLEPEKIYTDINVLKLAIAAGDGDIEEINRLVESGVDVNSVGLDGLAVLLWPIRMENYMGTERLLQLGASPNYQNKKGVSAIELVTAFKKTDYLKLMLKYGGNPNHINQYNGTILLGEAIIHDRKDAVDVLLASGVDVNLANPMGNTALYYAIIQKKYNLAMLLINHGADASHKDNMGFTIFYTLDAMLVKPKPGNPEYESYLKLLELKDKLGIQVKKLKYRTQ